MISTYTPYHRRYYETHKEEINKKRTVKLRESYDTEKSEKKKNYYLANRERILENAKQRYIQKKNSQL